jgi:hypothetical protein
MWTMTERRPAVAVLTALSGIAIGVGALLPWVEARGNRPRSGITHTSVAGLFRWSYENSSPFLRSFGAVVLLAGILVLLGGLAASRLLAGLFSLVALAAAGLWIGLNASRYSPTDLPYQDLRAGAWLTMVGGLVGLLSSFMLRRRRVRGSHTVAAGR